MKAIAILVIDSLTSIGKDKSDLARGNFPKLLDFPPTETLKNQQNPYCMGLLRKS
jgi:hypothetical protein